MSFLEKDSESKLYFSFGKYQGDYLKDIKDITYLQICLNTMKLSLSSIEKIRERIEELKNERNRN